MHRFWETARIVVAGLIVLLTACFFVVKIKEMPPKKEERVAQTIAPVETVAAAVAAETTPVTEQTLPPETTELPEMGYATVPRYFQTDYPYIKYGNGTIATSGCSMTCLAMVASFLTGEEYTPDELVYHFGSFGKNNIERLEHVNAQMQLPCEPNADWRATLQALQEGKVAIAMVDDRSFFTNAQHFIVLAGMTEDGKILVNDPIEDNYSEEHLENGFREGFEEHYIVSGFEGAWIYDKNAMPEEPFLYDTEKPVREGSRYAGYELPEEDIYTLACFAWAVARTEPEEVQQAVLEVVLNRVVSEKFPNTVREVIYRGELSGAVADMERAAPDFPQYRAVTAAMYGPYVLPAEVLYFSQWEKKGEVWGELGSYTFLYSR